MAYSQKEIEEKFDLIIKDIEVNGKSLRQALEGYLSPHVFYEWINEDEEKRKRYAHACEVRAETIFDDILDIADNTNADITFDDDMNVKVVGEAIQRSKLKIDARKWVLSKMNPKKYGDKVEHGGEIGIKGFNVKDVLNFDNSE